MHFPVSLLRTVNSAISLFLVLVTGILLFFTIPKFGHQVIVIRSEAMEPSLRIGDLAIVDMDTESIVPGDVIAVRLVPTSPDVTFVHRVIAVDGHGDQRRIVTKGDMRPTPDAPVSPDKVVGRVIAAVPYVGAFVGVKKIEVTLFVLIVVFATLIGTTEIMAVISELRQRRGDA